MSDENATPADGFVVRMPKPRQVDRAAAVFGAARFHELEDADSLVKRALDDGRLEVEWDAVIFDGDPVPTPRKVPVFHYGYFKDEPDHLIRYNDRYDTPTWKTVRKGRTPTIFPTREAAQEAIEDHREESEFYGVPTGQIRFAQVVPLSEWRAGLNPKDRSEQRRQRRELDRLTRQVEEANAELAAKQAELTPSESEHEPVPEHGTDEWRDAIVAAVAAGEGSTSVARRFGTNDRQVRRYVERAKRSQPQADDPSPSDIEAHIAAYNES